MMSARWGCLVLLGLACTRAGAPAANQGGAGGTPDAGGETGLAAIDAAHDVTANTTGDAAAEKTSTIGDLGLDRGGDDEAVVFCRTLARARADRNAACAGATAAYWLAQPDFCASVEPGAFRIDSAKAEACLRAVTTAPCPPGQSIDHPLMREACREPFVGLRALGASCRRHIYDISECDPGPGHCQFEPMGCGGTCRARGKLGEPCGQTTCEQGLHCSGFRCRPGDLAGEGELCSSEAGIRTCASGLVCTHVTAYMSVCRRQGAVGDPCGPGGCVAGSICIAGTCRPDVRRASGEPCGDPAGERCADGLSCTAGRCVPPPGLGESCSGSAPCREGHCAGGVCTKNPGPGDACEVQPSFSRCAAGTYCHVTAGNVGTCVPTLALGAACGQPADRAICGPAASCLSGVCQRSPACW